MELSVRERYQLYEEVHGVADILGETPGFVASSFRTMRDELGNIPKKKQKKKKKKKAYNRAIFLRPSIEMDTNFHLLFLRAKRFDPAKAAALMCTFFHHKLELFGESNLAKRITIDDLSEAEKAMLHSGACQLLPAIDQAGRGVYLMTPSQYDIRDWKSFIRYACFKSCQLWKTTRAFRDGAWCRSPTFMVTGNVRRNNLSISYGMYDRTYHPGLAISIMRLPSLL